MSDNEKDTSILGLEGTTVPKEPGDPSAAHDSDSLRRRKQRIANAEADESAGTAEDADRQRSGATGIDMGSGGQGTHLSGK
jgi:hypothetical protein